MKIEKIFEKKIWIESDIAGACHVMVQHNDGVSEPFCYCSFHYSYAYTSNASVKHEAEQMALRLGAKEPVEYRQRVFNGLSSES